MSRSLMIVLLWAVGISRLTADTATRHWAFLPLHNPTLPLVQERELVRMPIDAFLLSALEKNGLSFAERADRETLIRRACFDLTGLPPTPEEVDQFLDDNLPDAYARLIDRLLAAPSFGERWGRHWLDAAGYADVVGGDNDAHIIKLGVGKWRYRDYVVRSYNTDKPFDQFLTEQLAGDELVDWRAAASLTPEIQELLIATGFLRTVGDDTDEPELNTPDVRHRVLQKTVETVAGNLLALTVQCAKCHDHKYDPITQRDYYSLTAFFTSAYNPEHWLIPKDRQLNVALADSGGIPAPLLAQLKLAEHEQAAAPNASDKNETAKLKKKVEEATEQVAPWTTIHAVYDVDSVPVTHVLKRGDHLTPGESVEPTLPATVLGTNTNEGARPSPAGKSSGTRLQFAHLLSERASPASALVARVQVNRVWQYLFGTGLVRSSENFGPSGSAPTHPELLEWLATDFAQGGWTLKPLLRKILLSSAYTQDSSPLRARTGEAAARIDPANHLLWHRPLRRLESEELRDAVLSVSGSLQSIMGGPALPLKTEATGLVVVDAGKLARPSDQWRRSIYVLARRNYHLTLLNLFDQPVLSTNCTRRDSSSVVTQTLMLLNDDFFQDQAQRLAARVRRETEMASDERCSERAFRICLGRRPTAPELTWSSELLEGHRQRPHESSADEDALAHLSLMLLNASEFLYVR